MEQKNKIRKIGLILLPLILVAVGLVSCSLIKKKGPSSETYQTAAPAIGTVSRTLTGEAKVKTVGLASLFVETAQKVQQVHVKVGDRVTQGDLLIDYHTQEDLGELNRQLAEAQLYLNSANKNLESMADPASGNTLLQFKSDIIAAKQNLDTVKGDINSLDEQIRQQQLRTSNLRGMAGLYYDDYDAQRIEREEYDTARANYRVAQAALDDLLVQRDAQFILQESYELQLDIAEEKKGNAQNPLSDSSVAARYQVQQNIVAVNALQVERIASDKNKLVDETVSPLTGNVVGVYVVAGGLASPYEAMIDISDVATLVVEYDISEFEAPLVELGQKVNVHSVALPNKNYKGYISKIAAEGIEQESSDNKEVVVPLEITLTNSDSDLKVGYTVDVEIFLEEKKEVLSLPVDAIITQESGTFVYGIVENTIVKIPVVLGLYGDKKVELLAGLTPKDLVILTPYEVPEDDVLPPPPPPTEQ